MKVGLIRCMQTEDMCPATTCFKVMNTKKLAFEGVDEDIEVIGYHCSSFLYNKRQPNWFCLSSCRANEECNS
ncbi:MAG: hypothetical protein K0R80_2941 [Clostridia bacterium]|nr:hypothetical protein [Clostridia bacterium]